MKKLHLSLKDKYIAGVCGGLSESLGINSNIIRIGFVISLFINGIGLLLYVILFLILPKDLGKDEIIDVEVEPDTEKNKIYRTRANSILAGVCSGLAEYLNWDVSIIRVIFVVMTLTGGVGAIIYLIFWFMFPLEEESE